MGFWLVLASEAGLPEALGSPCHTPSISHHISEIRRGKTYALSPEGGFIYAVSRLDSAKTNPRFDIAEFTDHFGLGYVHINRLKDLENLRDQSQHLGAEKKE